MLFVEGCGVALIVATTETNGLIASMQLHPTPGWIPEDALVLRVMKRWTPLPLALGLDGGI
jgi:hypothetical protein